VINLDAVSQVIDFPCNADGSFVLPSQLTAFSVTHINQVPHLHQQAAEMSRIAWKLDFPEDTTQTYLDMFNASGTYAGRFVEVFAAINQADELLGLATLVDDDGLPGATEPGPWLAAVFVVPEARKLGVGSALIDHVVNRSRELGYSEMFLYTDHQQKWYEKRGWTYTRDTLLNDMKHVVMRNAI
jgi:GNAT superfamily N-acetyltransferase